MSIFSTANNDHIDPSDMKISQQIESIETVPTTGELGALLLESKLIKKYRPLYNRKLRIKRKLVVLKSTVSENGYYKEKNLCGKLLGLEKGKGECFNFGLDRCLGACTGKENFRKYNLCFLEAFLATRIKPWPFRGIFSG